MGVVEPESRKEETVAEVWKNEGGANSFIRQGSCEDFSLGLQGVLDQSCMALAGS
jgi:hypothetical protein